MADPYFGKCSEDSIQILVYIQQMHLDVYIYYII